MDPWCGGRRKILHEGGQQNTGDAKETEEWWAKSLRMEKKWEDGEEEEVRVPNAKGIWKSHMETYYFINIIHVCVCMCVFN